MASPLKYSGVANGVDDTDGYGPVVDENDEYSGDDENGPVGTPAKRAEASTAGATPAKRPKSASGKKTRKPTPSPATSPVKRGHLTMTLPALYGAVCGALGVNPHDRRVLKYTDVAPALYKLLGGKHTVADTDRNGFTAVYMQTSLHLLICPFERGCPPNPESYAAYLYFGTDPTTHADLFPTQRMRAILSKDELGTHLCEFLLAIDFFYTQYLPLSSVAGRELFKKAGVPIISATALAKVWSPDGPDEQEVPGRHIFESYEQVEDGGTQKCYKFRINVRVDPVDTGMPDRRYTQLRAMVPMTDVPGSKLAMNPCTTYLHEMQNLKKGDALLPFVTLNGCGYTAAHRCVSAQASISKVFYCRKAGRSGPDEASVLDF